MTSDAKVGLLLGLVFIFLIAIIINGLPSFRGDRQSNGLTTNSARDQQMGLANKEHDAYDYISKVELQKERPPYQPYRPTVTDQTDQGTRYKRSLPGTTLVSQETVHNNTPPVGPPAPKGGRRDQLVKSEAPGLPKFYTVEEGDLLATIAKKFYGPEEGNKRVNVERIFKANRHSLKNADEIYVGQKLVIPAINKGVNSPKKAKGGFAGRMFEKVKSIGRSHPGQGKKVKKPAARYTVKEDDNLWRIATAQLGDGNRYQEIVKLNADLLEDEDIVVPGMRLKMPVQ